MTNVERYNLNPKAVQELVKMGGYLKYEDGGSVIAVMPYENSRWLVEFRALVENKLPRFGWAPLRHPLQVKMQNRKDPKKNDVALRGRPASK
jgi:hypothetical protein